MQQLPFKLTKSQSFKVFLANLYVQLDFNDSLFFLALQGKLSPSLRSNRESIIQIDVNLQLENFRSTMSTKSMNETLIQFCTHNNIKTKVA